MHTTLVAALVGLATALPGNTDNPDATSSAQLSVLPIVAPTPGPIDDDSGDPLGWAVADFAAHTREQPDDIDVVLNQHVTWPDSSLGCPQPDHMYIPVQVDGHLIVLHAGDQVATYHGAQGKPPFRCQRSATPNHVNH